MRRLVLPVSCLALALVMPGGCAITGPDPLHCTNNDGDAYCAEKFPDGSRQYCELGLGECLSQNSELGCAAERPTDECYSPCGGRSTINENGECVAVEDSSSGSSSGGTETEGSSGSSESSTTGPVPCIGNEDCPDAAAPLCEPVGGECVRCDAFGAEADAACAGLDAAYPVCLDGACVQCTAAAPEACTGMTPVCDDATNTCVPCNAHDQCGEAACNLFTGACLPADAVVHVGPGQKYATIGAAVDSFDVMTEGTIIVHAGSYNEAVTVNGGRVLAFLVNVGDLPEWDTPAGNPATPQLTVTDATVLMDGLQVSGNGSSMTPGLRVNGARAWLDRSRIVANTGGGIVAESGAELVLRNCFVGGSDNNVNAVRVDGASAEIVYSTLTSGFAAATALSCNAPLDVSVRNSILLLGAATDAVVCPEATITDSATEDLVGAFDGTQDWFTDYFGADLSLTPSGALIFADIAQWQTGDPPTDIDGDPRPAVDGTADYAGADVPSM